jgi:glutaredoxin
MKNLFFMLPNCQKCLVAKDLLEIKGIYFEEINVSSNEGMKFVEKYGIGKVPALIVLDKNDEVVDSVRGIEEIEGFFNG